MNFTKLFSIACISMLLAGCSPSMMVAVSPETTIELMKGEGSVQRSPEGQTTFRYLIHEIAYSDYTPEQMQTQAEWLISNWVGSEDICPSGYTINYPPERVQRVIVYTGACK